MADIDLYGGDAQRIRNQYRTSLGRDASDDEVSGWLSGSYGGGTTDNWLNQIQNSGEAQAYRPQQPQTVGQTPNVSTPAVPQTQVNQNTDWWSQHGVPQSDMFDFTTGQMKPGWSRITDPNSATQGYQRTSGYTGPSNIPGPQGGNYDAFLMQLTQGKQVSPQMLKSLEPILNQHGIKLGQNNARGFTDGVFLPDGTWIDMIEGATENGGVRWQTLRPTGGTSGGPGSQYNDPYTRMLEELMSGRLRGLMQPVNDPNRQMYEQMLQQRAQSLATMTPELNKQIAYLEDRFKDLQGPGYTGAENEAVRTGALDPIETDRQAARKRVLERLSARGLTPDSGIAQQALLEVDKAFDSMRGTTQTALTMNDLNRREDRSQRAEGIRSTLSQIPEGRAREQLDVYGALNQLSLLARQEDEARQREAVGYGGALADLGPQRLQLAMQAAGMGGNPSSMFSNLMQLAGLNQNSALYGAQNSQSLWSGLGSIAAMLANAGK